MFPFDRVLQTENKSKGTNTKQYIILHHTAGGSFDLNCNVLSGGTKRQVSCHFLIGQGGESAKIGDPNDILRHAGDSAWGDLSMMNNYSMGIEFIDVDRTFTQKQYNKGLELIVHLMRTFNIPKENVLTHTMITNYVTSANASKGFYQGSKEKRYWKPGEVSRKTDIDHSFRQANGHDSFQAFQNHLGVLLGQ